MEFGPSRETIGEVRPVTDMGPTWVTRTTSSLANGASLTSGAVHLGRECRGNRPGSAAAAETSHYLVAAQESVRSDMPGESGGLL